MILKGSNNLSKYDNMSPRDLKEACSAMERSMNTMSAALIALIKMSKHQQLLVPRDFLVGSKRPKEHDKVFVSLVGTRYCFKLNDAKPGEKSLIVKPTGFDENQLSGY